MLVAFELHKTLGDVKDMPLDELADWLAFFKVRERLRTETTKAKKGNVVGR